MSWFKYKSYPEFWNRYASHFKASQEQEIEHIRFIVFDTETTGLNTSNDRILSIGAVAIQQKKLRLKTS